MSQRVVHHTRDFEATLTEVAAAGGVVRVRFDHDAVGVELPRDIALATCAVKPATPMSSATQIACDAWLSGSDPHPLGGPAESTSLALGVIFVWPQLGKPEAVAQQKGLLQHVLARSRGRGPTRLRVWQFDMDRASWANAKHDALWELGEHDDTKSLAASLLECDPGTRYDTSVVYFFAPYRLRRLQATIIREERHSFRDIAETRDGAPVRRHIAMVRLASPEAIVSDVA